MAARLSSPSRPSYASPINQEHCIPYNLLYNLDAPTDMLQFYRREKIIFPKMFSIHQRIFHLFRPFVYLQIKRQTV